MPKEFVEFYVGVQGQLHLLALAAIIAGVVGTAVCTLDRPVNKRRRKQFLWLGALGIVFQLVMPKIQFEPATEPVMQPANYQQLIFCADDNPCKKT